jgi:hypothetical protein
MIQRFRYGFQLIEPLWIWTVLSELASASRSGDSLALIWFDLISW